MFEWQEILFLPREHKRVIFLLYRHTDDGVFDDFPKARRTFSNSDFPKMSGAKRAGHKS